MKNKQCSNCSKLLIGKQRRWCSHICEVKIWQSKNKKLVSNYKKKYLIKNPLKRKESVRKYNQSHPNQNKLWREKNPEKAKIIDQRGYKKNKNSFLVRTQKRRAIIKGLTQHFSKAEWMELKKKYNFQCLSCGEKETDLKKLSPDHVIPIIKGGSNLIDNIQPLCLHCNLVKNKKIIDFR